MRFLKYAGICAAGFFTEYLLSAVFSAFLAFLVLYPAAAIPCCILSGKIHAYYTKRIRDELHMPLVGYCVTALALPLLAGAAGLYIGMNKPEIIMPSINSTAGSYAGIVIFLVFGAIMVNAVIMTASGAYHVYKEHST